MLLWSRSLTATSKAVTTTQLQQRSFDLDLTSALQFDKLTVRAVTEPVEVQSNDFGFPHR
jgi:hypothetical protein